MIPSGRDAWKNDDVLRRWFEIAFDTSIEPHQHKAYICKSCWRQFEATSDPIGLNGHAIMHQARGELPYASRRSTELSGEQVCELYRKLSESFEVVMPAAGTWKFQCRLCGRRLPHRRDHLDLLRHAEICEAAQPKGRPQ